jgi:hypothetical protein
MSMADNIKNKIQKKKAEFSSEAELRDLINEAASKAMKQFIQRMSSGEIPIDNMSDFMRVVGVYKEINGISEAMEGQTTGGALPEISMKQDKVFEDTVRDGKIDVDEEGLLDVTDMSSEEVAELLRQMDIAQNKANEGSF